GRPPDTHRGRTRGTARGRALDLPAGGIHPQSAADEAAGGFSCRSGTGDRAARSRRLFARRAAVRAARDHHSALPLRRIAAGTTNELSGNSNFEGLPRFVVLLS